MAQQLILISASEADWRLDDHTRDIGRRGVSEARAALRRVAPSALSRRPVAAGAAR